MVNCRIVFMSLKFDFFGSSRVTTMEIQERFSWRGYTRAFTGIGIDEPVNAAGPLFENRSGNRNLLEMA